MTTEKITRETTGCPRCTATCQCGHERKDVTTVYRTQRQIGEMVASGLAAALQRGAGALNPYRSKKRRLPLPGNGRFR